MKPVEDINQKQLLGKKRLLTVFQAWLAAQEPICAKCGATEGLTVDHIVPKSIIEMFGYDPERWFDPEDLQVLCKVCNMFKSSRLDFRNPRTKEILLTYLKEI